LALQSTRRAPFFGTKSPPYLVLIWPTIFGGFLPTLGKDGETDGWGEFIPILSTLRVSIAWMRMWLWFIWFFMPFFSELGWSLTFVVFLCAAGQS